MITQQYRLASGATLYYRKFEYSEVLALAHDVLTNTEIHDRCESVRESAVWTGSKSLAHAIEIASNGWKEGVKAVEKHLNELDVENMLADIFQKSEMLYDVQGSVVDVGAYMEGLPEHMVSLVHANIPRRAVKLIIALDQHCDVSGGDMLRKAANNFLATEALRLSGHIVDVFGVQTVRAYRRGTNVMMQEIPIQKPGDYLSTAQLAFMVGHPSFLRRIIFTALESEPEHIRADFGFYPGGGYGLPIGVDKMLLSHVEMSHAQDGVTYIIDKDDAFGTPVEEAQRILDNIALQQGIVQAPGRSLER